MRILCSFFFLLLLCVPQTSFSQMPITPQSLQGTWTGSNGQNSMSLQFMGNTCLFTFNGQQLNGMYQVFGNQIAMMLQNGKKVSYAASLNGNNLVLDGSIYLTRSAPMTGVPGDMPGSQTFPQMTSSPLDGTWSAQVPQGVISFRFMGNQYEQSLNGHVFEVGNFVCLPDGTFRYTVTQGQYAGQQGQNRLSMSDGQSFTMYWPDGAQRTYARAFNTAPGTPAVPQAQSPFEGRWIWAKQGPATFSYIFQGSQFIFYWNGTERSRGHFSYTNVQLIFRHETGPDAGKQDFLGYQLNGNRLLLFTRPDENPIPFVRY